MCPLLPVAYNWGTDIKVWGPWVSAVRRGLPGSARASLIMGWENREASGVCGCMGGRGGLKASRDRWMDRDAVGRMVGVGEGSRAACSPVSPLSLEPVSDEYPRVRVGRGGPSQA